MSVTPRGLAGSAWCTPSRAASTLPCIDYHPDFPHGQEAPGWSCRYVVTTVAAVRPAAMPTRTQVGDWCDANPPVPMAWMLPRVVSLSAALHHRAHSTAIASAAPADSGPASLRAPVRRHETRDCPLSALRRVRLSQPKSLTDHPWFEIEGEVVDVGFGQPISIDVRLSSP